jgi:hypothetical protein
LLDRFARTASLDRRLEGQGDLIGNWTGEQSWGLENKILEELHLLIESLRYCEGVKRKGCLGAKAPKARFHGEEGYEV